MSLTTLNTAIKDMTDWGETEHKERHMRTDKRDESIT